MIDMKRALITGVTGFVGSHLGYYRILYSKIYSIRNLKKEKYKCPICGYYGPFEDISPETGVRKNARCPKCCLLERHRLQFLVLSKLAEENDFSHRKVLHFSPEIPMMKYFKKVFGEYISADLCMDNVDFKEDITNLSFNDSEFDFIFASHVLEHVKDDHLALSEVARVLRLRGIAILPVPIISDKTVEYPEPNPHESYHVRAPGFDYFERYKKYFSRIELYSSKDFPEIYQTFIREDRTSIPSDLMPYRPTMTGDKHVDIVPVCYK